jgi:hypothetical protein
MKTITIIAALSTLAGLAGAQGPHGSRVGGIMAASNLNPAKVQSITGTVSAVNIGHGMEYPSIVVNKMQIKIAPVWYLLDKGFELRTGDAVSVSAAPAAVAPDPYLYALEITNLTSTLRIVLRDSNGVPLWRGGPNGGGGNGPVAAGSCLDPATTATVAGAVDKINMGAGIQMPTLTLRTSDSKLLVLKLGPERILLSADFEVKPGDSIHVTYAVETCNDELVALSITTASGVTLKLRGDDCMPVWN